MIPADNSPESQRESDSSVAPSTPEINGQNGGGERKSDIWPFDGPQQYKLSPEELEYLREQWAKEDEKQIAADLRDMLENGGLQLADFLPELKRAAGIND